MTEILNFLRITYSNDFGETIRDTYNHHHFEHCRFVPGVWRPHYGLDDSCPGCPGLPIPYRPGGYLPYGPGPFLDVFRPSGLSSGRILKAGFYPAQVEIAEMEQIQVFAYMEVMSFDSVKSPSPVHWFCNY